jgi:hypothetical protein
MAATQGERMIHFDLAIDVERPSEDVFAFVADFRNMPRWNYFVTRVDKLTAGPIGVGTRFHQIRKSDQQDYEITRLEPDRTVEITTSPSSSPALTMRFELARIPGGTRLTDTWTLATGHPRPLEQLGARRVRAAVSDNLAKLKQLLETGTAQLQDGRVSTLGRT